MKKTAVFLTVMALVLLQSLSIGDEAGKTEDSAISNVDSASEADAARDDVQEMTGEIPDMIEMSTGAGNNADVIPEAVTEEDQAVSVNKAEQIPPEENDKTVADATDGETQSAPAVIEEKKEDAADAASVEESRPIVDRKSATAGPAADNVKQQENRIGQENNQESPSQKKSPSYYNLRPVSRDQYRPAPGSN